MESAKVLLDTDDDDFTPNVDHVLTLEHVKREPERLKRQLKVDHVRQMQSCQLRIAFLLPKSTLASQGLQAHTKGH